MTDGLADSKMLDVMIKLGGSTPQLLDQWWACSTVGPDHVKKQLSKKEEDLLDIESKLDQLDKLDSIKINKPKVNNYGTALETGYPSAD